MSPKLNKKKNTFLRAPVTDVIEVAQAKTMYAIPEKLTADMTPEGVVKTFKQHPI